MNKTEKPLILEIKDVHDANKVDADIYRFEKHSESRDCYIFIRRAKVRS